MSSTVQFTLATDIASTEYYVSSGDEINVEGMDVPTFYEESNSATGAVTQAAGNASAGLQRCSIHIHTWADAGLSELICSVRLYQDQEMNWKHELVSVESGYQIESTDNSDGNFTFTLTTS